MTDSGREDAPIVIGAYGEGDAPRIEACGQGIGIRMKEPVSDSPTHVYRGMYLPQFCCMMQNIFIVEDLEITNQADKIIGEYYSLGDKMNRTGVAVVAKDKGVRHGITLRNLLIHDVNGNVYDKHMNNGGIYMTALRPQNEESTG